MKRSILVMGALGQLGIDLSLRLFEVYGKENVILSDIKEQLPKDVEGAIFEPLHDCTDEHRTIALLKKYDVQQLFYLPSLLSVTAEHFPQKAFETNLGGLYKTLEALRTTKPTCAMFFPSTIGVFGRSTPTRNTPQETIIYPSTMYGITKFSGELLCDYYSEKYGLDIRGVRYPGIISHKHMPMGGTTDYAVQIFHDALSTKKFTSYLQANTTLDMMYMPDAIDAALQLMQADRARLQHRNGFNITAMSFDVATLVKEIQKHIPDLVVDYHIDPIKQKIADSWPDNMDDSVARKEWGWNPTYDLSTMVSDMIAKLSS